MNLYVNHLIECQCILPLYKKSKKLIFHKFTVFSEINDNDEVKEKYVSCNNCDSIHKVTEVLKSEVVWGNDSYKNLVTTIEDIKFNLSNEGYEKIINILEQNNCEISIWENINFLIQNDLEESVIISKEEIDNSVVIKKLFYLNNNFKLKKEIYQKDFFVK